MVSIWRKIFKLKEVFLKKFDSHKICSVSSRLKGLTKFEFIQKGLGLTKKKWDPKSVKLSLHAC